MSRPQPRPRPWKKRSPRDVGQPRRAPKRPEPKRPEQKLPEQKPRAPRRGGGPPRRRPLKTAAGFEILSGPHVEARFLLSASGTRQLRSNPTPSLPAAAGREPDSPSG